MAAATNIAINLLVNGFKYQRGALKYVFLYSNYSKIPSENHIS